MDTEISKVQALIEAVDKQIRDVESSYKAVLTAEVSSNEAASMAEEKQFLREKLLYLREEKKSLWEEKKKLLELKSLELKHLREKEKHLREKEKHQLEKEKHLQEKELLELKHQQEKELLGLKSKVVPSGDEIMKKLQRLEKGMFATLWLNFWGELSSTVSSETTEHFRTDLVTYYGDATDKVNVEVPEKPLRCMVTDLRLPGKWITAAHLLARKDKAKAHVFGFHDINDPRNGLLWFRAFEEAFSLFQIVFSWKADTNTFLIHILDANLCNQKISEVELRKKVNHSLDHFMDANTKREFERLTFADLEGKSIVFNNLNRPYKRVLSLHAKLGVHQAKLGGILPPHLELDKYNFDYWTEAADNIVLHTFLKDSQHWIDGKGIYDDEEEVEAETHSVVSIE